MRILVLDDDVDLRRTVQDHLRRQGISVDAAGTLAEADLCLMTTAYDVAVLDRSLPDGDAATLLARLRAQGLDVPALFLTARDSIADRIESLDSGADDHLGKPFALAELAARIRALGRRRGADIAPVLRLADLVVDPARGRAERDGKPLTLTPREFDLLEMLVRHRDQVVSRTELLEHCWDEMSDPSSNVVDARVARLRSKLGPPPLVHTVRGRGYVASTGRP